MQVLVGARSPLARRTSLRLSDLAGMPYYTMHPNVTPDGYMSIMRFFSEKRFQPHSMVPSSSHESMMLQLQVHDDGYGLMEDFLYRSHPGLVFIPLEEEDQPDSDAFDLVAMWRANNGNPCIPQLLALIDRAYPGRE